jgi:hypothetical protein
MTTYDFLTVLLSATGAGGATAFALTKIIVTHRLTLEVEKFKSDQEAGREENATRLEAQVRKEVEILLGDRAADREYALDARKRLYAAIGPLRFQLLLACRDLTGRIISHGTRKNYSTSVETYYGRSTLFRIIRPLALSELIERQIAYADFAVDPAAVRLLKFKKAALPHSLAGR